MLFKDEFRAGLALSHVVSEPESMAPRRLRQVSAHGFIKFHDSNSLVCMLRVLEWAMMFTYSLHGRSLSRRLLDHMQPILLIRGTKVGLRFRYVNAES